MQIGSKFTIGVHIITAIDYFKDMDRVNSEFLAPHCAAQHHEKAINLFGSLDPRVAFTTSQPFGGVAAPNL